MGTVLYLLIWCKNSLWVRVKEVLQLDNSTDSAQVGCLVRERGSKPACTL